MRTKKTAILTLMATTALTSFAQMADTVVIDKPQQVIITQRADSIDIRVAGKEGNPDYRYQQTARLDTDGESVTTTAETRHSALGWDFSLVEGRTGTSMLEMTVSPRIEFGFLIPVGVPSDMSTHFFKSSEASISLLGLHFYAPRGKWWFGLDWGVDMQTLALGSDRRFTADGEGHVSLEPYPTGASDGDSRLLMVSNVMSLNFNHSIGKRSYLSLAAEWQTSGDLWNHCRCGYTDADGKSVVQRYDVRLRKNTMRFKLAWGFSRNGCLYARFAPWSPFRKGGGPQFSVLSFGLGVGF